MTPFGRYLVGLVLFVGLHGYLVFFLRRWTKLLARRRAFYAALSVVALLTLASAIEHRLARADVPTWTMRAYGPLEIWEADLLHALPIVAVIDLVLRRRDRRARAALPAEDAPEIDREESPEEIEYAGEEAERAVAEHQAAHFGAPVEAPPAAPPPPIAETPELSRRRAIAQIGVATVMAGVAAPLVWGALRTRFDIEVVELPIRIARLPKALDGFAIVQVSDVHVGPFVGARELARAEELVRGLRPDLVAMTGDLVHLRRADVAPGVAWLARLAGLARHGVVAITGNHEYYVGRDLVFDAMRAAKIDVLFNEGRVVAPEDGGGFALVGTDDFAGPLLHRGPGPEVARPLLALPPDAARILLCHQPQFHETAATFGFDLQLSGHTHGGQIAPLGPMLTKVVFKHVAGLSAIGDSRLYVNRGIGVSGPPTRVGVRPEITKVVLVAG